MLRSRIIPCLLMHEGGLVKTKNFQNPKYVGDPINAVKIFNEKEVDELILLDITAWKGRGPNFPLLEKISIESRMPLCYGGGVKNAADASRIINLGFEKISMSSAAVINPHIVGEVASVIGSQSVVVTLDVRHNTSDGSCHVYIENGKRRVECDLMQLCSDLVTHGAGEIVVNSIDREGEMNGYDLALARQISNWVSTPITFLGGAGKPEHMAELIQAVGVVGAGAGTMFVFKGPFKAVLISYSRPPSREDL